MEAQEISVDVLIIGSGPIGATFASRLVDGNRKVLMIDAGAQQSARFGAHQKNAFLFQRNIDLFVSVIRGHLSTVSVPTRDDPPLTLDPSAFRFDPEKYPGFIKNGQNPEQNKHRNLDACASTYAVGGMATHWTCATPQFHENLELNWTSDTGVVHQYPIGIEEMKNYYKTAKDIIKTNSTAFDASVRHQLVRTVLKEEGYPIESLPLAVERRTDNPEFVTWSGTDTVLGDLADPAAQDENRFRLWPEHQCTELVMNADRTEVQYARVWDLNDWNKEYRVVAQHYIVACNAVLTPQLLHASGFDEDRLPALGRYVTEQPMSFCQVVLHQRLVDDIKKYLDPDYDGAERIDAYRREHPQDPVPIPINEPEPNLWLPVTESTPWHCQIHRDAFSYGDLAPDVDPRLIVDLRWFGLTRPRSENRVTFSATVKDTFGMPQPTFSFSLSKKERAQAGRMMQHMTEVASYLGGYLPGSEPQFVKPGLPLHIAGTTRMGLDQETSVVDTCSKVHGTTNLYLGGNGLHPSGNAANPTLTSMAMALRSAEAILDPRSCP
ncbi:pyranose oxidase [Saccharothrix sp. ALI-22-I]|uniref:pyranose oxidase n=1 Tax=Saccharothrix sp. ALI-22-I TaxID=1933778 RepID=UPI00097BC4BB|nr:pyranose oxidase [Saccharothrix sp. ALI-22-I]ONI90721.1 pyranose oxidase [Saccharothrix sp. ALI-22-I]